MHQYTKILIAALLGFSAGWVSRPSVSKLIGVDRDKSETSRAVLRGPGGLVLRGPDGRAIRPRSNSHPQAAAGLPTFELTQELSRQEHENLSPRQVDRRLTPHEEARAARRLEAMERQIKEAIARSGKNPPERDAEGRPIKRRGRDED